MSTEERSQITFGNNGASNPLVIHTSSDLAPAQGALVEGAIKEVFGSEAQVKFQVAPNLVAGIELTANGHKIGWSIADYLTSLESNIDQISKEKGETEPKLKTEPKSKTEPRPEEHGI